MAAGTPKATPPAAWIPHTVAATSVYEAAGVADFDGDGQLDIISGDTLYVGPGWRPRKVRQIPASPNRHYSEDFGDLPLDVNGDGHIDVVTCAYFSKAVAWVENPGGVVAGLWREHVIDTPGPSETCRLTDIDGDGDVDLLPNTVNTAVYFEYIGPHAPFFVKHVVGKGGHGVGLGDVDGDGYADVVVPQRWYAGSAQQAWVPHAIPSLGTASVPILVADFDGNGLSDLLWGHAHDRGVSWARQIPAKGDLPTKWQTQVIDTSFTQAHALVLADLGHGPSVVTGKRIYAHESEAGATEAPVIVAYTFDRSVGAFHRELIYEGQPASRAPSDPERRDAQKDFSPGSIGTGLDLVPVDLDKDGDLDLVCPGKSGLYWLENPVTNAHGGQR